jgi:opacity protein-like surface antigen
VSHIDTLATSVGFDFPVDKASQYMKSDFSSRFGLGYTIGAAYSFSPQLYIDLRITQNVWDNMKTNAAREISNGFFKVPSFHFSLGYRFRKFTPDN